MELNHLQVWQTIPCEWFLFIRTFSGNNSCSSEEVLIIKNDIKKIGLMLVVGLSVAIVIYPVIHELGHSIVAIIVGAEVIEFNILPLPSVLCNVKDVGSIGMVLISIGGSVFPLLLVIISPKRFWSWYSCFTIRWISLWSYIISEMAIISFCFGVPFDKDDITYVLMENRQSTWIYMLFYLLLIMVTSILIAYSRPIKKIISEIENKKRSECGHCE